MKQASALIGALIITGIVGAAMVLVGVNVFFNKNSVPVSNSPPALQLRLSQPQLDQPKTRLRSSNCKT